ncbi:MFS transporter [Rhizobium laguerreae]|uniref:MFS transporter n=1 Tax=Rhizobium laguerreae TaxID=1076926 RepID=UPI001C9141A6|nr:MFS transporter [Rhizobium laguerreae]MBY3483362.1 MFS transporter [Rhizobium laguerreae]
MNGAASTVLGPLSQDTTTKRPILIVAALLLAAFVVGFDTRVFTVGLPDLRGAYGLGADEGAWFATAANAPQIFIASAVAWLMTVYGVRRVMIPSSLVYAALSFAIPSIHNHDLLFAAHIVRALLLGVFVPATLMIIFRNLAPKYWIIGLGIYTLRIPLSQSMGFALVGYYGDVLGWQWLYWQDVLVAPLIALLLVLGAPREPIDKSLLANADWGGMLLLGSSMTFIYIALDQGNRLDWLESGLVESLFLAGGLLFVAFLINESIVSRPWAHASVLGSRNVILGLAVVIVFTFASSAGSTLIPGIMQTVGGLRPFQISGVFILYAVMPVAMIVMLSGLVLTYFDARAALIVGLSASGVAALIGSQVTSDWYPDSFGLIVLLHTTGQVLTFYASFVFLVGNSDPKRSTAMSAYIQVARLGSAELAAGLMGTWIRRREQFHSNVLGAHLANDNPLYSRSLAALSNALGHNGGGTAKAVGTLSASVRSQSYVLAYSDCFIIAFWFSVAGLVLVALMKASPPSPLSPRPLFRHIYQSRA